MRLADLFSASLDAGLYYALSGLMHTTRLTRGFDSLQSVASLSRRNPLKTGWRILPFFVLCMYSTTQTSFGSVQTAFPFPWPAGNGSSNGGLWSFGRFLIARKSSPTTPMVTCPLYASFSSWYCPSTMLIMWDSVHLVREGDNIKILGTIEDREMEESDYIIYTFHIPTGEITEQRFVAPKDCKRFLGAGDYCPETGAYVIPMDIGVRIYNKELKAESTKRTEKNVYGTHWLKGGKYFIVDYMSEWQLYSYTPGAVPKLEARNQGEYTGLIIPQDSSKSFFCCAYYEAPFVLYQIIDD